MRVHFAPPTVAPGNTLSPQPLEIQQFVQFSPVQNRLPGGSTVHSSPPPTPAPRPNISVGGHLLPVPTGMEWCLSGSAPPAARLTLFGLGRLPPRATLDAWRRARGDPKSLLAPLTSKI